MRQSGMLATGTVAVFMLLGLRCAAAAPDAAPDATANPDARREATVQAAAPTQMRYVPPDRGAPEVRVSGGTRGEMSDGLQLDVLAPQQIGLTAQEQPTLYWYSSRPIAAATRVAIIIDDTNRTLLNATLSAPTPAGIHGFPLRGTTVRLAPNTDYEWTITAELSVREPSRNIVARGMIRRVVRPDVPGPGIVASPAAAAEYARLGLWYDALDALSSAIDRAPGDARLRTLRGELLQQVGLQTAAGSSP